MSINKKQTSSKIVKLASDTLRNPNSSQTAKKLAGSAMSQYNTSKQTGPTMEDFASKVLKSSKYSDDTKSLAGAVLSQSNKRR
ncbi:hypothetical protein [Crassaminicella indica]|uniref:Uncharacterized protein n=1 Tax=Crassaminicella indica TaxID=2855394 RepID=A0ABX8RCS6_9CLOT|nr:hypothetical protein [Crassaminicella indica]QXM05720.1 hypothetical protein KVH43_10140 [Crassaminicella indica]